METRTCKKCQQNLDISKFKKLKNKYYSHTCNHCVYLSRNINRIRQYDRIWKARWREENPDKLRETQKLNYEKHREKRLERKAEYYKRNREKILEKGRKYRQTEHARTVRNTIYHRYRARKLDAFVEDVDRDVVFKRDKGICHICGLPITTKLWDIDHIVPLSRGGKHSYRNVAVAHRKCNAGKKNRTMEEYKKKQHESNL